MSLGEKDKLGWVCLTNKDDDLILVTTGGQALRIPEHAVRSTGRQSSGIRGIRLGKGDQVASMEVVEKGGYLMVVTANGFGKRTALDEYPLKTRGTGGIKTIDVKHIGHIGRIVAARVVQNEDEITLITSGGVSITAKS